MNSESIGKLAEALSKAQGEMGAAKKDTTNTYFKSKYADLAAVWDACRGPLSKNGLSVVQTLEILPTTTHTVLVTMLLHSSGEWVSGTYPVNPVKHDPQGFGSATTYARRYSLMAIVGIAPEDDDGEAAQGREERRPDAKPAPRPIAAPTKTPLLTVSQPTPKNLEAITELTTTPIGPVATIKEGPTSGQLKRLFAMLKAAERDEAWLKNRMIELFGDSVCHAETGVPSTALLNSGQLKLLYNELEKLTPKS